MGRVPTDDERNAQGVFSWPPRPFPHDLTLPPPSPEEPPAATAPSRLKQALVDLERFWLTPIAEPLSRRLEDQSVWFDASGRYCDRCGVSVGPYEADDFGCAECRDQRLPWTRAVRLGEYAHGLGQSIIDLKFRGQRRLATDLGRRLGLAAVDAGLPRQRVAVTPVAMAWTRRFTRPFDHAKEIAAGAARVLEAPLVPAFHRRHRPSQRSVPASRRAANVRGSFRSRKGVNFEGWTVLLVDDVRTTGATLMEASRVLHRMGAQDIWVGVIAVASSRDRRVQDAQSGDDQA